LYDIQADMKSIVGDLNDEGWIDFSHLNLFSMDESNCPDCNERLEAHISVTSNNGGAFRIHPLFNETASLSEGKAVLKGKPNVVLSGLVKSLEFRPACIVDSSNELEINVTFTEKKRNLETSEMKVGDVKTYKVSLDLNSQHIKLYRGKFVEMNSNANGQPPFFKEAVGAQDTVLKVSMPFFKGCKVLSVPVDVHGIFEFNMTLLKNSVPYLIKLDGQRAGFENFLMDYFVSGFPLASKVEMGQFL